MKTCLIVDDSATIRKIIRMMFTEWGFHCAEAENGAVAYDHCVQALHRPDVVMLDWNMPVMSGIEFIRKLSALWSGIMPAVIFCTTESNLSFITRALDEGATDYIIKPFEKDMLRTKLERIFGTEDFGS